MDVWREEDMVTCREERCQGQTKSEKQKKKVGREESARSVLHTYVVSYICYEYYVYA